MMGWLDADLIWPGDADAATGAAIRLRAASCPACERAGFPSTGTCTWCGAPTEPRALEPAGRLVAATAVLHKTPGADVEVPYLVALVRFDAARVDVLGTVVGTTDLDALPLGAAMTVVAASPFSDGRLHYAYRAAP
jgi:uncharacterized OB-fold protein